MPCSTQTRHNLTRWTALLSLCLLALSCEEHRPIRAKPGGGHAPGKTASSPEEAPPPPPPKDGHPVGGIAPTSADEGETIPPFPWPPPKASATEELPRAMFEQRAPLNTLGNLNDVLAAALQTTGYFEKSYYAVPHGFALATRLEQISDDGSSKTPPDRWSAGPPRLEHFSISEYLRALFTQNPGYYRVVVFVVTDVPFAEKDTSVSLSEAQKWLTGGANQLPPSIANSAFTHNTLCTALIYEFTHSAGNPPELLDPSRLDAHTHLIKSGLWGALGGTP